MHGKLAAMTVLMAFLDVACNSADRIIPTDEAMKEDVKGKIACVYPAKAAEIGVTVHDGVVMLTGTVDTAQQRNGVKSVIDNLTLE